jgi:hypothetical protein
MGKFVDAALHLERAAYVIGSSVRPACSALWVLDTTVRC